MQIGCRSRRLFVEGDKLFCSMLDGCRFGLEDNTVVFYFEGMLCDGFCASVGYNKPATCTMFSFGSICKASIYICHGYLLRLFGR